VALGGHFLKLTRDSSDSATVAERAAALTSATQWFNELFFLSAGSGEHSGSSGGEGSVPLSPRLLCPALAWEWLVSGAHPAAAISSVTSSATRASWVGRVHQASFGELLELADKQRKEAASLRADQARALEQVSVHAGEARALRTRLSEMEALMRGRGEQASEEHDERDGGDHTALTELKRENQVLSEALEVMEGRLAAAEGMAGKGGSDAMLSTQEPLHSSLPVQPSSRFRSSGVSEPIAMHASFVSAVVRSCQTQVKAWRKFGLRASLLPALAPLPQSSKAFTLTQLSMPPTAAALSGLEQLEGLEEEKCCEDQMNGHACRVAQARLSRLHSAASLQKQEARRLYKSVRLERVASTTAFSIAKCDQGAGQAWSWFRCRKDQGDRAIFMLRELDICRSAAKYSA